MYCTRTWHMDKKFPCSGIQSPSALSTCSCLCDVVYFPDIIRTLVHQFVQRGSSRGTSPYQPRHNTSRRQPTTHLTQPPYRSHRTAMAITMTESSPLMRLPLELREIIYSHYFAPEKQEPDKFFGGGKYKFRFELLRVCKRIYYEAQTVWRRKHVFVRIETPWPQAGMSASLFSRLWTFE